MSRSGIIWTSVIERFEQHAPASVMARTALEHALPAGWPDARASSEIDEVFDEHRERQYSRELLFSTVVELVTLVSLGLRPSLHAAAWTMDTRPVTLAALYDKVNRTEPAILRALVRGSAERLAPVAAAVDSGTILPGWRLRVLGGNHLPASEKRLVPLRGHRGAALPGQSLVVYDPDSGLVTDIVASERWWALPWRSWPTTFWPCCSAASRDWSSTGWTAPASPGAHITERTIWSAGPTPEVSAPPDGVVEAVVPEGFPFSTRDPIHQVDGAGAARIMDWFPIHTCR